jgi:hypothetical protein
MIRAIHLLVITSLTLMFAATASNRAKAGSLVEDFSGAFGPTTTLDEIALGSETTFRFQASFDPMAGTKVEPGVATFATSLAINITGHGTYTTTPGAVDVVLTDPSFPQLAGRYGTALSTSAAGFSSARHSPPHHRRSPSRRSHRPFSRVIFSMSAMFP